MIRFIKRFKLKKKQEQIEFVAFSDSSVFRWFFFNCLQHSSLVSAKNTSPSSLSHVLVSAGHLAKVVPQRRIGRVVRRRVRRRRRFVVRRMEAGSDLQVVRRAATGFVERITGTGRFPRLRTEGVHVGFTAGGRRQRVHHQLMVVVMVMVVVVTCPVRMLMTQHVRGGWTGTAVEERFGKFANFRRAERLLEAG